ncbi:MAG: hypothetical protein K1X79_10960 [Oligoflexia bacterium]|nr:hypothetical protein [Oligoflexia bacterium]
MVWRNFRQFCFLAVAALIGCATDLHAESSPKNEAKASYSTDSAGSLRRQEHAPFTLAGGSTLTLITPTSFEPLAKNIQSTIEKSHSYLRTVFGEIPAFTTEVRLMDEETFFLTTGAPRWTNAMFFRNQIIVPLGPQAMQDLDNVYRAVRHEFTHAVLHAMTKGRCPGWIDEGLAQWSEGSENPALRPAMRDWLAVNQLVPFRLLQGGFTKLDTAMVPAAYGQSLYASKSIIAAFGFSKLRAYFDKLRDGESKEESFIRAFGMSEADFEQRFGTGLREMFHAHVGA